MTSAPFRSAPAASRRDLALRGLAVATGAALVVLSLRAFVGLRQAVAGGAAVVTLALACVVVAWVAWCARHEAVRNDAAHERRFVVGALVVIVVTRALWALGVPSVPVSDFAFYHALAQDLAVGAPFTVPWPNLGRIAAWGYSLVLGGVYAALGPSLVVAKLVNVALAALSGLALYALAREVGGRAAARVVLVLFTLWPGQIFYTGVLASEHLGLPAVLAALAIFVRATRDDGDAPEARLVLATGLLLGVAFSTRSVLGVAFVAVLAALALDARRTVRRRVHAGALIAGALLLIVAVEQAFLAARFHVTPSSGAWWSLLVGSNVASGGQWNLDDVARFTSQPDLTAANRFARDEVWRRLTSAPADEFVLAVRKVGFMWKNGWYPVHWSTTELPPSAIADALQRHLEMLVAIAQAFHALVLALGGAGLVVVGLFGWRRSVVAPLLFVVLGTAAHAVLESQPRYNYVMVPVLLVFAGVALALVRRADRAASDQTVDGGALDAGARGDSAA